MSSTEHERFGDRGGSADSGMERWPSGPSALLEFPRTERRPRKSSAWAYRKAALIHPSNLIALACVLMLGLIHPTASVALFGLGAEILFFYAAPKSQWVRRCLDEGFEEAERAEARRLRETLVGKIADGHRDELTRIEGMIKRIEEHEEDRVDPLSLSSDLDLPRVTASYIRLALAHKACTDALAESERRPPRIVIRSLEAAEKTATDRVRVAIHERLTVARARAAQEARVREDLEVYSHQLAMLADCVELRCERVLSLGPSAEATRFMQQLEEERSAAREVSELTLGERLPERPIAVA